VGGLTLLLAASFGVICAQSTTMAADAPQSAPELLRAFKSAQYSWQQQEIAEKLVALGDKSIVAEMLPMLQSPEREERCNAGLVLAALGEDRGFHAVVAEMQDMSERPTTMTRDDGSPYVAGQIEQDRYFAAVTLALIGDRRAVPALIDLLKDKSLDYQAAISLGRLGDARAVPALRDMLAHGGEWQRLWAAYGLAKIGDPAGVPALAEFLKAPVWVNRRHAANALREIRDRRAVPALIASLKDDSPDVRNAAADALGEIGDPMAIPALQALTDDAATNTSGNPRPVRDVASAAVRRINASAQSSTKPAALVKQ
jgi:HEAT repeat protein